MSASFIFRLNVHNLKLSRSQKRVLNVWKEFLQADKRPPLRGNVQNFVSAEKRQAQKLRSKQSSEPTQPQKSRTKDRSMKLKEQRKQRAFERLRSKGISIEEVFIFKASIELLLLQFSIKKHVKQKRRLVSGRLSRYWARGTSRGRTNWRFANA